MSDSPSFEEFYEAINGRPAFPWQGRLAAGVAQRGRWWVPNIGIPTGLGKTACLDIAVWSLAVEAARDPGERRLPTRIWWVVNRRLLVDAATDHAERLAARLTAAHEIGTSDVVGVVAARLASLSPEGVPLEVVRLRGGAAIGRPRDPAQPAILLSTIPMYGSRLLFRGYGSSRSMRPIDAALAGTDSLVLVDEAHLAHHLTELFVPLHESDPAAEHPLPPPRRRPAVVALTATGVNDPGLRFDLDERDRDHPVVQQRLHATKRLEIETSGATKRPDRVLADAAVELLVASAQPASCVVFVNTPAVARAVFDELTKRTAGRKPTIDADLALLTGQMREREAVAVRERVLGAVAAGARTERDRHFVVVATQTLEVGADVDFELLVTEACGVRSLTQRLGRLNRLGQHATARGRYCHIETTKGEWPVYGIEPLEVLNRLRRHSIDDAVDLSPGRVGEVLGEPGDDPGVAPSLLPALLWEWAKTTTPPPGEAPVEPYFSGLQPPDRQIAVCWRAHLPVPGNPLWPRVREEETVEISIGAMRGILDDRPVLRLATDRHRTEEVDAELLRPGDVVVLGADGGDYDEHGWAPGASGPVVDMAILRAGLPLDHVAWRRLVGAGAPAAAEFDLVLAPADDDERSPAELVGPLVEVLRNEVPPGYGEEEWRELIDDLELEPRTPVGEVAQLRRRRPPFAEVRLDELDELSLAAVVDLDAHGVGVGGRAGRIARSLGLDEHLVASVELAGTFHDVGKADPRFQRWLDPEDREPSLVAKSDPRRRSRWRADLLASGWPSGGRHEELSRRLVESWLHGEQRADADLLMHLVVTHHGHGRPLVLPAPDDGDPKLRFSLDGREVVAPADLSAVDWAQPGRFAALTALHGHWGLALLEAIIRQADHRVSAGSATLEVA